MKNWRAFLKESLTGSAIREQIKPGSHLWRIFIFSLVAAISTGVIYSFVNEYLGGTRAATETVTVTTGASKSQVAINEEFTINVLFTGANAKKISQLDFRMNIPEVAQAGGVGEVAYVSGKTSSSGIKADGSSIANYFDTTVLEQATPATGGVNTFRYVFTSRRPEAELTDKVSVKFTFKGLNNGEAVFNLDTANIEVVGPGGENVPTTFTFGNGSSTSTKVLIGQGPTATNAPTAPPSATPTKPAATVTVAPTGITTTTTVAPTTVTTTATVVPTKPVASTTPVNPTGARPSTAPTGAAGNTKVTIRAKFNGIGANVTPVDNTIKAKVTFANPGLATPIEQEVEFTEYTRGENGISLYEASFNSATLPINTGYTVYIKGEQHLMKKICDQVPTETADGRYMCGKGNISIVAGDNLLDFTKIYQLAGDLPISNVQSGFIDSVDVVFIRANFGSREVDKLEVGDLNKDGIIDTQDYALAIFALSFKYDEVVNPE